MAMMGPKTPDISKPTTSMLKGRTESYRDREQREHQKAKDRHQNQRDAATHAFTIPIWNISGGLRASSSQVYDIPDIEDLSQAGLISGRIPC